MKLSSNLLLEDSDDDAFLMERALRSAEIWNPIHRCQDGGEAIEHLKKILSEMKPGIELLLPLLVVADIGMPRLSGLEVLRWIREHPRLHSLIVIILSSSKMDSDLRTASKLNVNAYIVKPIELSSLEDIAHSLRKIWIDSDIAERSTLLIQQEQMQGY